MKISEEFWMIWKKFSFFNWFMVSASRIRIRFFKILTFRIRPKLTGSSTLYGTREIYLKVTWNHGRESTGTVDIHTFKTYLCCPRITIPLDLWVCLILWTRWCWWRILRVACLCPAPCRCPPRLAHVGCALAAAWPPASFSASSGSPPSPGFSSGIPQCSSRLIN